MSLPSTTSEATGSFVLAWQMPILAENYVHRDPLVTGEEASFLEQYATEPGRLMTGVRMRKTLNKLHRLHQPFLDTLRLRTESGEAMVSARRHLFKYMAQTRRAFWSWSKDTWIEVIEESQHRNGVRFWMIALAYLFSGFLYMGDSTPWVQLADTIFGEDIVDTEVAKLRAPLIALGYSHQLDQQRRFRRLCAMVMLANRSPYAEAISPQILAIVNEMLASFPDGTRTKGRQDIMRLQVSLCNLGILDEPAILASTNEKTNTRSTSWQSDASVEPTWRAWICAFYDQMPHYNESSLRQICYHLLAAGRWLKKVHPEVIEPSQWNEALALEYVTYTCQAVREDRMLPSQSSSTKFQKTTQKLSPSSISKRLAAMRVFFSHLQRRPYTVEGKHYPKLRLNWLSSEAFKTPDAINAALQPNPRDIQEDAWFKLIWAACTLTKEQLDAAGNSWYPLAYYRAAALIWVTSARRSDEIRRLSVGCVRREWAPEMRDEHGMSIEPAEELCYLRIPTNKMRGEFYVPVPPYVADAIEVWESVRPSNQKALVDRKTRKPTNYLFQYRNDRMGRVFLNDSVIPLLCKLAAINQIDVVGRITSHRARATTATWMHKMGMAPADIGKLLGHTNPLQSLPWYLREDKHRLGRAYRKANPLERYVAAILDTNAHARQEPCVFYYLADGPDGRPRMCGNPHFSRCIHQLMCIECEAFIDHEQAEAIEKRDGAVLISVPIPLPPQMVAELNEQDEAGSDAKLKLEALPPPMLPGPAFHFNKKVPLRSAENATGNLHTRLAQVEAQIAKKQGKADRRSASLQALLKERAELQARLAAQEGGP